MTYESIRPFFGTADSNLAASLADQDRIQAYDAYEGIYDNNPETFKLVRRGEDDKPMYIPSAKKIVEATNRFLAVGWDFVIKSNSATAKEFLDTLFRRERVYTKFSYQRRYGLIRGDAIWHFIADKNKAPGQRMTIQEVKPHHYFPIMNDDNPDQLDGVHLCNVVKDYRDKTKQLARRQTYRKLRNDLGIVTGIESSLGLYEVGKWDDRNLEAGDVVKVKTLIEPFIIPNVMAIPVYHIPNGYYGVSAFGASQLKGIESVIAGVNQALSDEHLTLVMQGLGMYVTNAGPPVDDAGQPTTYEIGPARVQEIPVDGKFERVSGVTSVAPMIEHMNFSLQEAQLGNGIPDIAAGKVDVAVAESGISLKLQLAPILAQNKEKEVDMLGTYDQMIYDLVTYWLPEFEDFDEAFESQISFKVDDPMPINRQAEIDEVIKLVVPPSPGIPALITLEMAIERLKRLGIDYPAGALEKLVEDAEKARTVSAVDETARRMQAELDAREGESGGTADDEE
jgi:hypothetical protein